MFKNGNVNVKKVIRLNLNTETTKYWNIDFLNKQPVYNQLALRSKSANQFSELDYLARRNSKKSPESNYCNNAIKKSAVAP